MSCMQITACVPLVNVKDITLSRFSSSSQSCALPNYSTRLSRTSLRLASVASRYQRCTPVCLFGGKGKPQNDNEASPWKSLENALGGLKKERSVQDILREQMQKQEFDDSGGGIGTPPSGGGGDGSGESKDEGEGILEEFLQAFLATVCFILLYIFIIDGEFMYKLSRDYIKYFFTRDKSVRVTRSMKKWQRFYDDEIIMKKKKKVRRGFTLERAILNMQTWWHDPTTVKRGLGDGSRLLSFLNGEVRPSRNRRRLASVY